MHIHSSTQSYFNPSTLEQTKTSLSRSLANLSSSSGVVATGDESSEGANSSNDLATTLLSGLSNGKGSPVQSATGSLGTMQSLLSQMGKLATLAQDSSTPAQDQPDHQNQFQALQTQLSTLVSDGTSDAGVNNDLSAQDSNSLGASLASLVAKDSSGDYLQGIGGTDTLSTINDALQQVSTEKKSGQTGAAFRQIESQNTNSVVLDIGNLDDAASATGLMRFNILAQSSGALTAQANISAADAYQLLAD